MTIREGMLSHVEELRRMTDTVAASSDGDLSNVWTDEALQTALDVTSVIVRPVVTRSSPTQYMVQLRVDDFVVELPSFGSSRFDLRNTWNVPIIYDPLHMDSYTVDPYLGLITFNRDREYDGFALLAVGYSLNKAAANIWFMKAGRYSSLVDFKTDNHTISQSQLYTHCMEMYHLYSGKSGLKNSAIVRIDRARYYRGGL